MAKNKLFKDASQGYISLTERYVTNLIDTFEMQRLKDVAQTGMRPIFSGATHDRFSHSLGVYNNAVKMYNAFTSNVLAGLDDYAFREKVKLKLDLYREYYWIACILHDIGHPAYSHTFEYLYNDNSVLLEKDGISDIDNIMIKIDRDELERLDKIPDPLDSSDTNLQRILAKSIQNFYEKYDVTKYGSNITLVDPATIHGQPHEMMGAYQILRSHRLQKAIYKTMQEFGKEAPLEYSDLKESEIDFAFLSCMIIGAKYIKVGHTVSESTGFEWDKSLKNCIVELLNGLMDADSMDYLNRNSHFAGYSTSVLDVTRLTNAFSAHFDKDKKEFVSCLEKSALSVMEGFIQARNFEPKWLYSHHKIVYCTEFLFKYLYKKCARYLYARDAAKWEKLICEYIIEKMGADALVNPVKMHYPEGKLPDTHESSMVIRKNLSDLVNMYAKFGSLGGISDPTTYLLAKITDPASIDPEAQKVLDRLDTISDKMDFIDEADILYRKILNFVYLEAVKAGTEGTDLHAFYQFADATLFYANKMEKLVSKVKNAYLGYVISPVAKFIQDESRGDIYFKTTDPDVAAVFKKAYLRYRNLKYNQLSPAEQTVGQEWEYPFFKEALEEFHTHKYRQSLWKSVEEYTLFLNQVSASTGLSRDSVSDILVKKLIPFGGKIEFEDPHNYRNARKIDMNGVFINAPSVTPSESEFEKVFGIFGSGLIIRLTSQKFKSFKDLRIYFGNESLCGEGSNGIVSYADISDQIVPPKKWIPYIYYTLNDLKYNEFNGGKLNVDSPKSEIRQALLKELKKRLEEFISGHMSKGARLYEGKMMFSEGNIIRDPVHGDIRIPQRFMDIIDTNAFQRLRRIKQLATADYVFPDAGHTRFSHSVGTFYVMQLMLERFKELFKYLNIECTSEDMDAALVAALLHDIGHGPYSHAFESIYGNLAGNKKAHEAWTKEIIEQDPELQEVFKKHWGSQFNLKVLDCLTANSGNPVEFKLKNVYASLISSQLDADRIDYLMRDSYHTGVNFGLFDLQRLISSLMLSEYNGEKCVCFDESALPIIEQFITGRYNMYSEVYYSPYKVFCEELLHKVSLKITKMPAHLTGGSVLEKILYGKLTLNEYLEQDDASFQREIYDFAQKSRDKTLITMVNSLFTRKGFKRLHILDDSFADCKHFLDDFIERFGIDFETLDGTVVKRLHFDAYNIGSRGSVKGVLISCRNGRLTEFENVTRTFVTEDKDEKIWPTDRIYLYYNLEILEDEWKKKFLDIDVPRFKLFIKQYDIRSHIEIENKYWCTEDSLNKCDDILKAIKSKSILTTGYLNNFADYSVIEAGRTINLQDIYYDTDDLSAIKNNFAIRRRYRPDKDIYIYTIKQSGVANTSYVKGQFIRSEYEHETSERNIHSNEIRRFFNKVFRDLKVDPIKMIDIDQLKEQVELDNNRTNYKVVRDNSSFECTVSLDKICYKLAGSSVFQKDYQIEIELDSYEPMERVELRKFSEDIRDAAGIDDTDSKDSKYVRCLKHFKRL